MHTRNWTLPLVLVLSLIVAGCGGGAGTQQQQFLSQPSVTLNALSITPSNASLSVGGTQQFTANGKFSDGSSRDVTSSVTWSSSSAAVAISASGMATAKASGATTISAKSGQLSASASVGVAAPALVAIAVQPDAASIHAGTTQQFSATGTYNDGSSQDLTAVVQWNSSSAAVADVSSNGLATGKASGQSSITASLGAVSGGATLSVTAAKLVDIAVSSDYDQVPIGATAQFTATGIFSDGSSQDLAAVQWDSSDDAIASVEISGVAMGVAQGTVTVTATSGSVSSTAPLTVLPAALVSIAISPTDSSIALGTTQQFTAVGTFTDGSTQELPAVTWSSQPESVATMDANGLATSLASGGTTIIASAGAISGATSLTVTPASLVSISVNPASQTIPIGVTQQFAAVGTFSDNSTQDITNTVTWRSSAGAVASISASGSATSLSKGVSTITASSGAVSGSATLNVTDVALVSISVSPSDATMAPRTSQQFVAVGHFNNGSTQTLTNVSWSLSSPRVAKIKVDGVVRAKHNGSVTITAKLGSLSGSTTLTVSNSNLVSIAVTPANASLPAGSTQQFTAIGTFDDNHTQDLTAAVHWSSSSGAVATVSNTLKNRGLATAVATGTTTVAASSGGISGSTTLVVTAP